jgi:uncharacterized coiled-coil protein SlyX
MSKPLWYRIAATAAAGLILVAIVSGQTRPAAPSGNDELLLEIKGLRADLNQRFDATIRAQLLVARLALQEQRITALSRQLTDVQQQLMNNERGRGPIEAQMKAFEAMQVNATEKEKKETDFIFGPLRSQLEQMMKADEELKGQQVYLSGLLAEEQSRWTAFNARLEELEVALTPRPGRK